MNNSLNLSDAFIASLCQSLSPERIALVAHQAKRCLLDYLGATLAGAQMLRERGDRLIETLSPQCGGSSVIGFGVKTDTQTAAFINGLSSHVAELDDGVISGIVHPGAPVLSALLPIAEKEAVNGDDLIRGLVAGYEATVRIANAIQPSHKARGYHATGTCGAIGAALGIASMLRFGPSQMSAALSAAAVSASGTLKVLEDDSELKPFNVGHAALSGILAAAMARAEFRGPNDAFSGKAGFLSVMADKYSMGHLVPADDVLQAVNQVYVKPYAACRYCHPAIDAALQIRATHVPQARHIRSIAVSTYYWAVAHHDHTTISGVSSAKMSIPYSVAVALVTGRAGLAEYDLRYINDPEVAALSNKVSVRVDDHLTQLFPAQCGAVVEVTSNHGETWTARINSPKGEYDAPLTDDELIAKFVSLARYGQKDESSIQQLVANAWSVEREMPALLRLL